jgi:hypothetical protein
MTVRIITGQFTSKERADEAVAALRDAGAAEADISVVEAESDEEAVLVTASVDETIADAAQAILGSAGVAESTERTTAGERAFEEDATQGYKERRVGDPIASPFPR